MVIKRGGKILNNIFIPKDISVGFQNRSDTYTGKLAYVIYTDQKGKLRKETSWNSWRDNKIDPLELKNEPTSGFVLNKKAGGYDTGWNHRQTYVRVYDPRGFEFEIEVPNLLYILENTNSIKGKGLEGEFVYGWDGKELVLIPTESPDYKELTEFNKQLFSGNKIYAKDLIIGATYRTKENNELIYVGKFDEYSEYAWRECDHKGKKFYFYDRKNNHFNRVKSIPGYLIETLDNKCVDDYADIFELLECKCFYSPIDKSKNEYVEYSFEEFKLLRENGRWDLTCYSDKKEIRVYSHRLEVKHIEEREQKSWTDSWGYTRYYGDSKYTTYNTLEELYEELKPCYRKRYLKNGKLFDGGERYEK